MISLAVVLLILLGIIAVIDWKFHAVPSVLLTGLLLATLMLNTNNLVFGACAGLLMLLIYELDKGRTGIADFKVMMIIGLMISTVSGFFFLAVTLAVFQLVYVYFLRVMTKYDGEIPFIPCLWAVYILLYTVGVIV